MQFYFALYLHCICIVSTLYLHCSSCTKRKRKATKKIEKLVFLANANAVISKSGSIEKQIHKAENCFEVMWDEKQIQQRKKEQKVVFYAYSQ